MIAVPCWSSWNRQVARRGRIGGDRLAGGRHTGRIRQREITLIDEALGRRDRDLARDGSAVIVQSRLAQVFVHFRLAR
jgi:hypothetical protein